LESISENCKNSFFLADSFPPLLTENFNRPGKNGHSERTIYATVVCFNDGITEYFVGTDNESTLLFLFFQGS
jgi:hypothetical protein